MTTSIRQYVPTWAKRYIRIAMYSVMDGWDKISGRREAMVPPRMTSLIVGAGNFKKVGKDFLEELKALSVIRPDHKVLEIGFGYGRMAVGLTEYLKPPGSYHGIEIIKDAVDWCSAEITSRHPHFLFHHADVLNPYSNPEGKNSATDYLIPFPDASFDLVFLTSVFTHMPPPEINAYLKEIARVLKPGGQLYATYYVTDEFAVSQIGKRAASLAFIHSFD